MVVGLSEAGQSNGCVNHKILHRFMGFSSLMTIIISLATYFVRYDFAIRYTNGPGNFTFVYLFFSFGWTKNYVIYYFSVGTIYLLMTITMLTTNSVHVVTGLTVKMKRVIFFAWIASLIAMLAAQTIICVAYFTLEQGDSFADAIAKKLAQIFLAVNPLDALFWIFGFFGLKIKNLENIYENALGINQVDNRSPFC